MPASKSHGSLALGGKASRAASMRSARAWVSPYCGVKWTAIRRKTPSQMGLLRASESVVAIPVMPIKASNSRATPGRGDRAQAERNRSTDRPPPAADARDGSPRTALELGRLPRQDLGPRAGYE